MEKYFTLKVVYSKNEVEPKNIRNVRTIAKIITIILVLSGVAGILLVLGTLLCKKSEASFNKIRPFECGFRPRDSRRGRFSLQFFLISLIFVIFDIELILLYPFVFLGKNT